MAAFYLKNPFPQDFEKGGSMEHILNIQHSFRRYEKKFLLTEKQYKNILPLLESGIKEDEYGIHTICNIYFDTDSFDLIRASVRRPVYKEKFRLRSYGVPGSEDFIFAEIKKKSEGVVYKRRVEAYPDEINAFICGEYLLDDDPQIQREIRWFLDLHRPSPKVFIGYERAAYTGRDDSELRVTFDWNMRWRTGCKDLREGSSGELILPDNKIVMEVKTPGAVPLWLAKILSESGIYPCSFSKYGTCYQNYLINEFFRGRTVYV